MSLRTDYDIWHDKHHSLDTSYDDTSSPWYRWVQNELVMVEGLRTLEVACGRGGFVRKLARAGALAVGLDFSAAALSIAQKRASLRNDEQTALFVQGDAHSLPFPDDYFDLLISCETIEHLPDPAKGVREFHRVAKPGAKLFLTTPNYLNLMGLYEVYSKVRHRHRAMDQPFDRIQVFFQTRRLLTNAGWAILLSDGTVHQLPIVPGHNPIQVEFLESKRWLRKLFRGFAYHYCLVARKI